MSESLKVCRCCLSVRAPQCSVCGVCIHDCGGLGRLLRIHMWIKWTGLPRKNVMSVSGFLTGLVQILSHYCLILFSARLLISVRECVWGWGKISGTLVCQSLRVLKVVLECLSFHSRTLGPSLRNFLYPNATPELLRYQMVRSSRSCLHSGFWDTVKLLPLTQC